MLFNIRHFKLALGVFVCMIFPHCNNPKHSPINQFPSATKFNGKVVNNIYYDQTFNYKIKIPTNWSLFDQRDLSRVAIPYKFCTFLVGFKSEKNAIYFYDDNLIDFNHNYNLLLANQKKELNEQFISIANSNNAYVKTYYFPNKTNSCFDEFRIDLYDKTTNKFDLSASTACRLFGTTHAIVELSIIFNEEKLPLTKETSDFICTNN